MAWIFKIINILTEIAVAIEMKSLWYFIICSPCAAGRASSLLLAPFAFRPARRPLHRVEETYSKPLNLVGPLPPPMQFAAVHIAS